MKVRGVVLVVALTLAVVAAGAVFIYIRGIQAENSAAQEKVPVVVSKEDIAPGTELNPLLSAGMFIPAEVPRTLLIRGVVTSLQQLQGQETSSPILAGEQISLARLRGEAEFGGGVLGIPPRHKAVTIPLEIHRAVGGVIRTGDHVSLYATFHEAAQANASFTVEETPDGATAEGEVSAVAGLTITLVPDVQVLHIGSPPSAGIGSSSSSSKTILVTMALRPEDAQRVVFAMERGQVWLGLIPPSETGTNEPPISFGEVAQ